jgi:hypothetical protein
MNPAEQAGLLLGLGLVVLAAVIVGLVLVAALQLALWVYARKLAAYLERHSQPQPRPRPRPRPQPRESSRG